MPLISQEKHSVPHLRLPGLVRFIKGSLRFLLAQVSCMRQVCVCVRVCLFEFVNSTHKLKMFSVFLEGKLYIFLTRTFRSASCLIKAGSQGVNNLRPSPVSSPPPIHGPSYPSATFSIRVRPSLPLPTLPHLFLLTSDPSPSIRLSYSASPPLPVNS